LKCPLRSVKRFYTLIDGEERPCTYKEAQISRKTFNECLGEECASYSGGRCQHPMVVRPCLLGEVDESAGE